MSKSNAVFIKHIESGCDPTGKPNLTITTATGEVVKYEDVFFEKINTAMDALRGVVEITDDLFVTGDKK